MRPPGRSRFTAPMEKRGRALSLLRWSVGREGQLGVHLSVQQSRQSVDPDPPHRGFQQRDSAGRRLELDAVIIRFSDGISHGQGNSLHSLQPGQCALLRRPRRGDGAAGDVPGGSESLVCLRRLIFHGIDGAPLSGTGRGVFYLENRFLASGRAETGGIRPPRWKYIILLQNYMLSVATQVVFSVISL